MLEKHDGRSTKIATGCGPTCRMRWDTWCGRKCRPVTSGRAAAEDFVTNMRASTGSIRNTSRARRCGSKYQDLYAGGEQLRANAAEYLVRRHKEPGEVYQRTAGAGVLRELHRLDRRLVCRDADAARAGGAVRGQRRPRPSGSSTVLAEDCDLKGTNLSRVLPAAVVDDAGVRQQLHGGGFSADGRRRADPGGGRCIGTVASVPGGLHAPTKSSTGATTGWADWTGR